MIYLIYTIRPIGQSPRILSRRVRPIEEIEATDERSALRIFAEGQGWINARVKRDGAGILYVGDATGRYRARAVRPTEPWPFRHSPPGTPLVLAEAVESIGGLR